MEGHRHLCELLHPCVGVQLSRQAVQHSGFNHVSSEHNRYESQRNNIVVKAVRHMTMKPILQVSILFPVFACINECVLKYRQSAHIVEWQ